MSSINKDGIEIAVSERLDTLRQALKDADISLAFLPKESGTYTELEQGQITILIPRITGEEPAVFDPVAKYQLCRVILAINLSLAKRYQDNPDEKDVLEFCADQIIGLLLNYKPPGLNFRSGFVLDPQGYETYQPEGSTWEAQIVMTALIEIRPIEIEEKLIPEEVTIKINALKTQLPYEPDEGVTIYDIIL